MYMMFLYIHNCELCMCVCKTIAPSIRVHTIIIVFRACTERMITIMENSVMLCRQCPVNTKFK